MQNHSSTGTSNPKLNSCSPNTTNTHNLLPTIIETQSQIPSAVLTQSLISMISLWWCPRVKSLPLHNNNKSRWGVPTTVLYYYCMLVCLCVYVRVWSDQCPHPSRATAWPPRRLSSILQLPPYLPSSLPHTSLFIPTNDEAAGRYDVCCITQGHHSLLSCIFFS